jgi:hypothetical protein
MVWFAIALSLVVISQKKKREKGALMCHIYINCRYLSLDPFVYLKHTVCILFIEIGTDIEAHELLTLQGNQGTLQHPRFCFSWFVQDIVAEPKRRAAVGRPQVWFFRDENCFN